ncbi:unnamed protein product [Protopolystoma xenopodis]|uniref:Small ribosomal subunit protein mS33 n=1 Tax=Protopolystoma xenopodis TaxID=117903 RepID=A0A3S5CU84_9PLAT|nr:unnamed protein product [Protopolystoma xenopodis]
MAAKFANRMAHLAGNIFVGVRSPIEQKSLKVVKLMRDKSFALIRKDWYPPLEEYEAILYKMRMFGLFRNEHADFNEEMDRLRELRGKGKKRIRGGKSATPAVNGAIERVICASGGALMMKLKAGSSCDTSFDLSGCTSLELVNNDLPQLSNS